MVAGGGQAEHSQCHGERNALLGSFDSAQDGGFGFAGRYPLGVESDPKQPDHHEEQTRDGEEQLDSARELQDSCSELLLVLAEEP
jgi:hypothetical protein